MRIIGYVLALLIVLLAMGDNLLIFIDVPSALLVVGVTVWGFLAAAGPQTGAALRTACSGRELGEGEAHTGLRAVLAARHAALAGGFLAAVAGVIVMLWNWVDPANLGPGMAMAILGLLYAVFLAYAVLQPLQAGIERRMVAAGSAEVAPSETPLDLLVLAGAAAFVTVTFAILRVSFKGQG